MKLDAEERERNMARARPRRGLPIAPLAKPGARRLPLAAESRDVDRQARPIYAVWEITLACDLACRHCGSRAGRDRPDELTTAEALDLVDQMARLGVKEVTLIGGEAYLRDDWLDLVRAIRAHGMTRHDDVGRARAHRRDRSTSAQGRGPHRASSVSIDGDEATHDRLRGVAGSYRSAHRGDASRCNEQRHARRVQHADQPPLAALPRASILETVAALGIRGWQIQLTVPMGRAADEPEILLQPYDLLELFPRLAALKKRCDELGVVLWPGNNIGYFGPYESVLRGPLPARPRRLVRRRAGDARHRGQRRHQGLPVAADRRGGRAATSATPRSRPSGSGASRCATRATARRDDLWGFCRTCYYAEECMSGCTWTSFVTLRQTRQQPLLPPPRARDGEAGQARARRPRRRGAGRALRPRGLRDRRRVAIRRKRMTKSPVSPCPSCARHVRLNEPACPFCGGELPRAFREQVATRSPAKRLNRAALHALRMSAIPLTVAACGGAVSVAGDGDAAAPQDGAGSSGAGSSGASSSSGGSSGSSGGTTSGSSSGGSSSGTTSSGGSSSGSSGGMEYDASTVVASYGGFIGSSSGGETDAADDVKPDHIFIAVPYGLPPH